MYLFGYTLSQRIKEKHVFFTTKVKNVKSKDEACPDLGRTKITTYFNIRMVIKS